jgi:ABC-type dipeptide/oligopeptide/nickel transport system permease subunit
MVVALASRRAGPPTLKQNLAARSQARAGLTSRTDNGRDVLSRVIWGTRISLVAGFVSVAIAALAGSLIGLFAGYRGGGHGLAMRLMDAVLSFRPWSWRWRSAPFWARTTGC